MGIEIENLKSKMSGRNLNIYQERLALNEYNKLIDYVNSLELLIEHDENRIIQDSVQKSTKK